MDSVWKVGSWLFVFQIHNEWTFQSHQDQRLKYKERKKGTNPWHAWNKIQHKTPHCWGQKEGSSWSLQDRRDSPGVSCLLQVIAKQSPQAKLTVWHGWLQWHWWGLELLLFWRDGVLHYLIIHYANNSSFVLKNSYTSSVIFYLHDISIAYCLKNNGMFWWMSL